MTFRNPVKDDYAAAVGRAVYVFSYLEWAAIWTGEKLSSGFIEEAVNQTAGRTAQDLKAIVAAAQGHPPDLIAELKDCAEAFHQLVDQRNDLIHSTPHTAEDGGQRLLRQKKDLDLTVEALTASTLAFESLAIRMNDLFHKHLA